MQLHEHRIVDIGAERALYGFEVRSVAIGCALYKRSEPNPKGAVGWHEQPPARVETQLPVSRAMSARYWP